MVINKDRNINNVPPSGRDEVIQNHVNTMKNIGNALKNTNGHETGTEFDGEVDQSLYSEDPTSKLTQKNRLTEKDLEKIR